MIVWLPLILPAAAVCTKPLMRARLKVVLTGIAARSSLKTYQVLPVWKTPMGWLLYTPEPGEFQLGVAIMVVLRLSLAVAQPIFVSSLTMEGGVTACTP